LLLGASFYSLAWFGCLSDPASTPSGNGGGSAAGGAKATGGATATRSAPEATADAIKAFIMVGTFKATPWKSETDAPREPGPNSASPHGKVRVWFNDTLQTSAKAGNGSIFENSVPPKQVAGPPQVTGSMAVKELYNGDAVVGTR